MKYYQFIVQMRKIFTILAMYFPSVYLHIQKSTNETVCQIKNDLNKPIAGTEFSIGDSNLSTDCIYDRMLKYKQIEEKNVNVNLISGAIYSKDKEHTELMKRIFPLFFKSNPLHPDIFPCIRKMESEIVKFGLRIFNGNDESFGCLTTGGTESILLACKAYRDIAYSRNIKKPEIIVCNTVHAAFDKACSYFNIKLNKVPVDENDIPDLQYLKACVNSNTILLVGSAPSYSHGIMDPIKTLSEIAKSNNIYLHVDSCLGGFILPFINNNFSYDFELDGVTSISADLHKYGNCPKGVSLLMYRNKQIMNNQYFVQPDWDGGIYATSTILGSRSGNLIAMSYATILHYGISGYQQKATNILATTLYFKDEIKKINHLEIIGDPMVCVIGIKSSKLDIYEVNKHMSSEGWHLNELQFPASIHICVTSLHLSNDIKHKFIRDLKNAVENSKHTIGKKEGSASIYGSSQKISNRAIVATIAKKYLDCVYE